MAPTSRYRPGQLVWHIKAAPFGLPTDKERCEIAFVVQHVSQEECAARGIVVVDIQAQYYFVLVGETLKFTSARWLCPFDTFPLEDE